MKKFLFFLLIILILSETCAKDVIIFSGEIAAGEPFTVQNDTFVANYIGETNATVMLLPEGISAVIYASSNKCTNEWIYSICQSSQKFQINGADVPPNINSKDIKVKLYLQINKTETGLNIVRNVSKISLYLDDIVEIKTRIEQIGVPDISNVSFSDYFSDSEISFVSSACKKTDSSVDYGVKDFDDYIICSYRVKPDKEGVIDNTFNLSYYVLGKRVVKTISEKIVVSAAPVILNLKIAENIEMMKPVRLDFNIDNVGMADLKELSVEFPLAFFVINSSSSFALRDGAAEVIAPKEKDYFITIRSNFSGNYTANVSLVYVYGALIKETKKEVKVNIKNKVFNVSLHKKENGSVVRLSNTEGLVFKNINILIAGYSFNAPLLRNNKFIEFSVPKLPNETSGYIAYQTEFGQSINMPFLLSYSEKASVLEETKEAISPAKVFGLKIPKEAFLIILVPAFFLLIALFIKSRPKKSKLDEEIEDIKRNNNV